MLLQGNQRGGIQPGGITPKSGLKPSLEIGTTPAEVNQLKRQLAETQTKLVKAEERLSEAQAENDKLEDTLA